MGQGIGHVKAYLLPVLGGIGVAGVLQFRDHIAITIQQVHGEDISTGMACARSSAVPPVTHCNIRCTTGHRKALRDAIITAAVTAEIRTVLSTMRIRRINDFIAGRRGLLPWINATLEATIVGQ